MNPAHAPIADGPTLDDFDELLHQRDEAAAERDRLAAIVGDIRVITTALTVAARRIPNGIAATVVADLRHALAGERR